MPKKLTNKPFKEAHVANTKYGSGDYYGTGIKQKVGRVRNAYSIEGCDIHSNNSNNPPRSLA